jgi:hypothetical protein
MKVAKAVMCTVPCAYKHWNVFKEDSRLVNWDMLGAACTIKCVRGISPRYGGVPLLDSITTVSASLCTAPCTYKYRNGFDEESLLTRMDMTSGACLKKCSKPSQ